MVNETVDPLDGYRGRPMTDEEVLESEVRGLQSLNESGIDVDLVRDVMRSDELIKAMTGDRPMARLVTYATSRLDDCSRMWSTLADPTGEDGIAAHSEARAARLLLNWIEGTLNTGVTSEKLLSEEGEAGYE